MYVLCLPFKAPTPDRGVCWFVSLGVPGVKCTSAFYTLEAEETPKREAEHPRLVGGSFNKQGDLHMMLVSGDLQDKYIFVLAHQNLKSLDRGLNRVQLHIQSRWSQQHSALAGLHP